MRNVNELERAWMRYKLRSYLPKAVGVFLVLVIIVISTVFIFSDNQHPKEAIEARSEEILSPDMKQVNATVPAIQTTSSKTPEVSMTTAPVTPSQSPVQLTPSLGFIASIDQTEAVDTQEITSLSDQPNPAPSKTFISPAPKREEAPKAPNPVPEKSAPEETSKISIDTHQDEEDIKEVISRFKVNKKPALSLFIAKRYYAIGRYRESYNYALITNDIDSDIEESWLIAAKSLVKMNEKEKAVNLLTQFIDRTFSVRAKMLLGQINNGTLE